MHQSPLFIVNFFHKHKFTLEKHSFILYQYMKKLSFGYSLKSISKKNCKSQLLKNLVIHKENKMEQNNVPKDSKKQDADLKIKNIHQLSKNFKNLEIPFGTTFFCHTYGGTEIFERLKKGGIKISL